MASRPLTGLLSSDIKRSGLLPIGRNTKTGLLEFALPEPIVGLLQGIELPGQAMRGEVDISGGTGRDYAIDRMSDVGGLVTLGAGAMPGPKGAVLRAGAGKPQKGIKAYHGSPHDFDQFQMDKIGTGEGAQAYGHGLYMAENPATARAYRDVLSAPKIGGKLRSELNDAELGAYGFLMETDGNFDSALRLADEYIETGQAKKILRKWQKEGAKWEPTGKMYEVNINANSDDFLDWDKPLSEQTGKAKEWVQNMRELGVDLPEGDASGAGLFRHFADAKMRMNGLGFGRDNIGATTEFAREGIPGIKYLDHGSRTAGEGSRNFVVFDDKLISIVKKYGIAGAVSLGFLSQQDGEAMAAQMGMPTLPASGGGGY